MSAAVTSPIPPVSQHDRYILTQVGSWVLVLPTRWVTEILRVQRSRILALPFYSAPLIGVTHHNSHILPLVSAYQVLQTEEANLRETSTIIHLSEAAGSLQNVGLVVDKALGSKSREMLPDALFETTALHPEGTAGMVCLQNDWFSPDLWHPQV
ncbi:chemotaxis protein CheW [Acaryochloris sp. IP29b_bin.148]|uniref:chemotaxis protein CheW n=1 Tax=Acaryochloris sp. IP29b_bin.148 TaxID=2969218 RepID=UPI00260829DE|nr:chemotaxis protein CheW [Acaryochloris sp. IP29b_bin.148]